MTGKQRMLRTLALQPTDRPPHFEHMFELEHEAFGLRFPPIQQWETVGGEDKRRLVDQCMDIYARIIERFAWDALAVYFPWSDPDGVRAATRAFGDRILIGSLVGGGIWCIDTIRDWEQFALDLFERPEVIHEEAERRCHRAMGKIDRLVDAGAQFISLVHDVASNQGPFCSPAQFDQIVTPYLARLVQHVKQRGAWCIVHSDGYLMPVLDSLLVGQPHVLHSIDPMAGMDIAHVKKRIGARMALMGNVQCDLLQHGPSEAIRRSALYCLQHASPGGGYIFSTSNTIYPGMPLGNYQYMLEVFNRFNAGLEPRTPREESSAAAR